VTDLFHWKMFGLTFFLVIALLCVGVAVQEWREWRRGR
jgi:hypothetical protein